MNARIFFLFFFIFFLDESVFAQGWTIPPLAPVDMPYIPQTESENQTKRTGDCAEIQRKYDAIDNETTLRTPMLGSMTLTKVLKGKDTTYYLSLQTYGSTLNVGKSGVTILFSDGTKFSQNTDIDVEAMSGGSWNYTSFFRIDLQTLPTLATKRVASFRLYIYDRTVSDTDAEEFRKNVVCLTKSH